METTMRPSRTPETDPKNDFDSFYDELERRILAIIADDDEDCVKSMAAKRSNPACITRQRFILEQQGESYFCWKYDSENLTRSVPIWLKNVWGNSRSGTGVFIPRAIDTLGVNSTRRSGRCRGKLKKL